MIRSSLVASQLPLLKGAKWDRDSANAKPTKHSYGKGVGDFRGIVRFFER